MTDQTSPAAPETFRYTLVKEPGSHASIKVDVDAERLERTTDRVFQRRVRNAKIPGFRPGKAPRAIYERTYGAEHLWHEAAEDVVEEVFREIVQRERIEPIGQPSVDLGEVEAQKPLSFTVSVTIRPEVAFGAYADHGVTVEPKPVQDEQVAETIGRMREHHAELKPVDRPVAQGDVVTVDIDGELDGKPTEPIGRNAHLEIGKQYEIPGLTEGLVGAVNGEERTMELTFPDGTSEEVKERKGRFTVKIHQIAEKILPEVDDDFAKTVGVDDVAALRKAVKNELAHAAFHEARDEAAEKATEHLLATSTVEIPEILVEDELGHISMDLEERAQLQGMTKEQLLLRAGKTEDQLKEEWKPAAERRAKLLLVLDALAERESIQVSGEELAQEAMQTPLARQDPNALRNPAFLSAIARSIRNRKTVDKLLGLDDPNAERDAIRKAGGDVEEVKEEPAIVIPEKGDATAEGRDAIRRELEASR